MSLAAGGWDVKTATWLRLEKQHLRLTC